MSLVCTFFKFGHLLNISRTSHNYAETFCSDFLYIEVWMTDHNTKPLEIEDVYQYRYIEEPTCRPNEIYIH